MVYLFKCLNFVREYGIIGKEVLKQKIFFKKEEMMDFKNKVILITGSTSGIGKEMAHTFLELGAEVIINYAKNDIEAKKVKKEFDSYKDNFVVIKADVSVEEEVTTMFQKIEEKYGKLDYLVNNAGIDYMEEIESFDLAHFRKEVDVNFIGRFICIQKAIPLLKKVEKPKIINIASRLGTRPMVESAPYCTCEAATIMLTKVCALELSKYNIKVNTISPSMTLTPLALQSYTSEEIEQMSHKNPSKRLGKPEDIASVAVFLLSDKADYINGENLNVNGGILLL